MKKFFLILVTFSAMSIVVLCFNSCEVCTDCKIIDPDYILDESGDDCDQDFVDRCKDYAALFSDVTCTC